MTAYLKVDGAIVQDFAKRTLENLYFIEQHQRETGVYEVTQLINSLLGLLVFPKETFWKTLNPVPITEISWLDIWQSPHYEQCINIKQLVRCLRNSVSHFGVSFRNNNRGEITSLECKDFLVQGKGKDRKKILVWQAEIEISVLRQFVKYFICGVIDGSLLIKEAKNGHE